MKPTFAIKSTTRTSRLATASIIASALSVVTGCTFTYTRDSVPTTDPIPAVSLPAAMPSTSTTSTSVAPTTTTTTTTIPPTTTNAATTSTAAPTTTTATTAAATGAAADAKPPYSYAERAITLPLVIDDALVNRVTELGWKIEDRQAGAFKGSPELAYYADSPTPETSPWVTIRTAWNARGVCDAFGVGADDPCENAGIIYKGRWSLHSEKLGTGVRVANNVSEQFGQDVMNAATWGDDLIPTVDESLLPPEMNAHTLRYVGAGLIADAAAIGAPAATLRLQKPRSNGVEITISTLGVNMPLVPYRLDLDSDATIESVKVNGNDALLTDNSGDVSLVWNTDTGLKYVNAFKDERAEAFLRSLIDS